MNWYKTSQYDAILPPREGYHVTYLSRANNIKNKGLLLPKNMAPNWSFSPERDRIHLFINPGDAHVRANDISLNRKKDWVLLKIINLDPNFLCEDADFGDTWQESIANGGTFAYSAPIPPSNIIPIRYAKETETERHDEFRGENNELV